MAIIPEDMRQAVLHTEPKQRKNKKWLVLLKNVHFLTPNVRLFLIRICYTV